MRTETNMSLKVCIEDGGQGGTGVGVGVEFGGRDELRVKAKGAVGLGREPPKPSLTFSGRSQCSRWGWGSEGSGWPLQWPSAE